ncbi:MAG TPA: hypothetical protein VLA21_05895 [Candidatus Limnocylindria bacterium]|nr:hypothetical protein [Candidatus Limnocylindria bacterium]
MNSILASRGAALKARELLSDETPLRRDCGRLCGSACCRPCGDGPCGMLLFPGEEGLYDTLPPGFELNKAPGLPGGTALLTCAGSCDREARPLACRVFPLAFTMEGGAPGVRMDPRAFAVCPLAPSGVDGLAPGFRDAARSAARALCESAEGRAFVRAQDDYIRALTRPLWGEGAS